MKSYPCTVKSFLLMELANICFALKDFVTEPELDILNPARRMAAHLPWSKMVYPQLPTTLSDSNWFLVLFEEELFEEEISSLIV